MREPASSAANCRSRRTLHSSEPPAWRNRQQRHTGLTRRAQQVAAFVAAGRPNREVAESLVITEATAEVHVKHILSKLGFKSRSEVAAWAAERGLPTSMSYPLFRRGLTDQEPRSGSRDNRQ